MNIGQPAEVAFGTDDSNGPAEATAAPTFTAVTTIETRNQKTCQLAAIFCFLFLTDCCLELPATVHTFNVIEQHRTPYNSITTTFGKTPMHGIENTNRTYVHIYYKHSCTQRSNSNSQLNHIDEKHDRKTGSKHKDGMCDATTTTCWISE